MVISDMCGLDAALQRVIPVTNSPRDRRQCAIDGGLLFDRHHEAVQRLVYPGLPSPSTSPAWSHRIRWRGAVFARLRQRRVPTRCRVLRRGACAPAGETDRVVHSHEIIISGACQRF